MQTIQQQQIVVYFIEEAKDHLDTIEQGLLDLRGTVADPERMNELFRAAHSVKGGAAMLGFNSIHKVGHHLEDCFKLLKEHPIKPDTQLENLFLKGFDTLRDLLEELQSPYGLRPEAADALVKGAEPAFGQLESYLHQLVKGGASPAATVPTNFMPMVTNALKVMLQLFKQGDAPVNRQKLCLLCDKMVPLHPSPEWKAVLQVVRQAIGQPQNRFATLAPVTIKELKQVSDLLAVGRASQVAPSPALRQLTAPVAKPAVAAPPMPTPLAVAALEKVTIPLDPKGSAKVILDTFNREQVIELAQRLMKGIQ